MLLLLLYVYIDAGVRPTDRKHTPTHARAPDYQTVITGSTDGIGRQYAIQLAARGLNIVLISRTVEKLMAVASEIEQKHQVKTKWIAADFSQGRPIYDKLRQELEGIPVGILGE